MLRKFQFVYSYHEIKPESFCLEFKIFHDLLPSFQAFFPVIP